MTEHTDANQTVARLSENREHADLLAEIEEVCRQIACNRQWFALEGNQDLIESCIYEDRALQARYRHLLEAARKQGITVPVVDTYF